MSLNVIALPLEERIKTGCSHMLRLTVVELLAAVAVAGATTALVIKLQSYVERDIVNRCFFELKTPFDGGGTTSLAAKIGYNGVAVDDDDAFLASTVIHLDGAEILASVGTGTNFAAQEAGDIELTLTSTGANLSELTVGEISFFFNFVRLTELRGING